MQRTVVVTMVVVLLLGVATLPCGCSGTAPIEPQIGGSPDLAGQRQEPANDGPYRLWGQWTFYIDESHQRVDVVPKRQELFHLNALTFLEEYCTDCLTVTNITSNGDSTINLTLRIKHPFQGHPEYTGFDVKGIIMFDGSWTQEGNSKFPPWPDPFRVSWRMLGDPQVLNADGYTLRWSPSYDSGQTQPIFNYWEGKYARGKPTANVNAYLNFYNHENRHMFSCSGVVSRTYHIWLPPGQPITAGYAVDACWEPPLVTPVTNPADDFPSTANQPEAYQFYFNLNNGQTITDPDCCGFNHDPSEGYMFSKQWGDHTAVAFAIYSQYYYNNGSIWLQCGDQWPDCYCNDNFYAANFPDGDYIGLAINYGNDGLPHKTLTSYTVFEFTIDLE